MTRGGMVMKFELKTLLLVVLLLSVWLFNLCRYNQILKKNEKLQNINRALKIVRGWENRRVWSYYQFKEEVKAFEIYRNKAEVDYKKCGVSKKFIDDMMTKLQGLEDD